MIRCVYSQGAALRSSRLSPDCGLRTRPEAVLGHGGERGSDLRLGFRYTSPHFLDSQCGPSRPVPLGFGTLVPLIPPVT